MILIQAWSIAIEELSSENLSQNISIKKMNILDIHEKFDYVLFMGMFPTLSNQIWLITSSMSNL